MSVVEDGMDADRAGVGRTGPDLMGEVTVATLFPGDRVLLVGWLNEAISSNGVAVLETSDGGGLRGRFRAVSWPRLDGVVGARWFATILELAGITAQYAGCEVRLAATGRGHEIVAKLPGTFAPQVEAAAALQPALGRHGATVVRFLQGGLAGRSGAPSRLTSGFLSQLLKSVSQGDGFLEVRGRIRGVGLLLQGWAANVPLGEIDLLVETDVIEQHQGVFAGFPRGDLAAPAIGFLGMVPGTAHIEPEMLRRVYYRSDNDWLPLEAYQGGTSLGPADALSHLRDVLPKLRGGPELLAPIRRAARRQYGGEETLSHLPIPVRAAVDMALRIEGTGVYLTGWLLDPRARLDGIYLRSDQGFSVRVDQGWTRIERPDVVSGFAEQPFFRGLLSETDNAAGFAVFVPETPGEGRFHLDFDLGGIEAAFLPVDVAAGDLSRLRHRLLSSIDLHKPSGRAVIEEQIVPLLIAAGRRVAARPAVAPSGDAEGVAVIVPLLKDDAAAHAFLSQFGIRRLPPWATLFLAVGPEVDRTAIARHLAFYGVPHQLLTAGLALDPCDALEQGVAATRAARLLFLSPSIFADEVGWIEELTATLERSEAAAVLPTILYEDFSVKFAGHAGDETPRPATVRRNSGYPSGWIKDMPSGPTDAGSLECCLVTRRAFEAVGGFARSYVATEGKELDFFLRLRKAGHTAYWTPEVKVYSLDPADHVTQGDMLSRIGEIADQVIFDAAWSRQPSGTSLILR